MEIIRCESQNTVAIIFPNDKTVFAFFGGGEHLCVHCLDCFLVLRPCFPSINWISSIPCKGVVILIIVLLHHQFKLLNRLLSIFSFFTDFFPVYPPLRNASSILFIIILSISCLISWRAILSTLFFCILLTRIRIFLFQSRFTLFLVFFKLFY